MDTDKLGIAAHLHVLMKRKLGRATDVEWMVGNREYALAMIRLSRLSPCPELNEWASKLEALMTPVAAVAITPARPAAPPVVPTGRASIERRYVGRLR